MLLGEVEEIAVAGVRSKEKPKRQPRKFDTDRLRQALEAVLQGPEDPPPSLKEVARRLDADSDQLQRYLPDLCRAISARYDDAMKAMRAKRVQRICDEVRGAVYEIHMQGRYPSMNAVKKWLKAPHVFREPEMLAVWRETVKELG